MIITYHHLVTTRDIPSLDSTIKIRVKRAIEEKLTFDPLHYGTPLHATLKQLWKIRVGDWRILFTIIEKREVFIVLIAHRKDVYKLAEKRL
ncbi:MAG: type II toxin-antitoxin system RelE/ParE family toxin [Candidatus Taylorbacteria bacterium]